MSLGKDIINWGGDSSTCGNLHVYYNGVTKTIRFQSVIDPGHNLTSAFILSDIDMVEININKNGMFLNGTSEHDNNYFQRIYNNFKTTPISIGSQEGSCKGVAKYNLVCLRKYRERRI